MRILPAMDEPGDGSVHESAVVQQLDEVNDALEQLATDLREQEALTAILERLCRQAVAAIPDAELATVVLSDDGDEPRTVVATDERARQLDKIQLLAGQGPCVDAIKTNELVRARLSDLAQKWPELVRTAVSVNLASVLSTPLALGERGSGSLNLYTAKTHGYRDLDSAVLEVYATAAETALQTEIRGIKARSMVEQLRIALVSRGVIDQAKGIIMAARGIGAEAAFGILVRQSQQQNRKVRDLAEEFVRTAIQPT
jgi:hypothetical protein